MSQLSEMESEQRKGTCGYHVSSWGSSRGGIGKRGVALASRCEVSKLGGIAVSKKYTFRKVTPPDAAEALRTYHFRP